LTSQLEDATSQLEEMTNENKNVSVPDNDLVDELEADSKSLRKEIRNLKRTNQIVEDKHREKIVQLERDLFVKDGQIQRLEDAKKDLKERYMELKEDWREERRSNRKVSKD